MSQKRWTILEVLDWTRGHFENKGVDSPRLDAEILIAHALDTQRVMLYARYDQPLKPEELTAIRELVKRRAAREPVAYLTGKREFWSIDVAVNRHTLIPRPDTETLVQCALDFLRDRDAPTAVDVGTGTGCIALSVAKELGSALVYGTERSGEAAATAQANAERLGLSERTHILQGNLLEPLPAELRADVIVANLPYIPTADCDQLMPEVRDFEPRSALDGGPDGLDLIRKLVLAAPPVLKPGGMLALEAGIDQAKDVHKLLEDAGFEQLNTLNDASGRPRVSSGIYDAS